MASNNTAWRWRSMPSPKIFVSYRRRGEGAGYGGRLADKLVEHFGSSQCFRDVEDIETGVDFVESIQQAVSSCEILVAVIGPDWTTQADDQNQPRLQNPNDFVRIEVVAALERNIRVIPVLVGGAPMPAEAELPDVLRPLCRRQAIELTDTRWDYDVKKLLQSIERVGVKPQNAEQRAALWRKAKIAAAILATGVLAVALTLAFKDADSETPYEPTHTTAAADTTVASGTAPNRAAAPSTAAVPNDAVVSREKPDDTDRAHIEQLQDEMTALREALEDSNEPRFVERVGEQHTDSGSGAAPCGLAAFDWMAHGTMYSALLAINGPHGVALVSFADPWGQAAIVQQDIHTTGMPAYRSFQGSNPRVPNTTIPILTYQPDTFALDRGMGGNWGVTSASDSQGSYPVVSKALPPIPGAMPLRDCM